MRRSIFIIFLEFFVLLSSIFTIRASVMNPVFPYSESDTSCIQIVPDSLPSISVSLGEVFSSNADTARLFVQLLSPELRCDTARLSYPDWCGVSTVICVVDTSGCFSVSLPVSHPVEVRIALPRLKEKTLCILLNPGD